MHSDSMRRLQTVSFLLAEAWFGCRLAPAVREEAERLPAATRVWFEEFALSPAVQRFRPNKDELWLHLSLLDSKLDALRVARRRLIPSNLPPPARATTTASRRAVYAAWLLVRLRHHTISLGTTLTSGARWWWRTNRFGGQFWTFLAAAVLFDGALFIFYLLYNLYLVDLGFGMGVVGQINAAQRAGSLVGTLPGAWIVHRFGVRGAVAVAMGATAAITLFRSVLTAQVPLTALAFAGGAAFAVWAVVLAPSIAGAVEEKRRPSAFGFFFAVMFAVGIAGNWLAGHLAVWLHGNRPALLFAAALSTAALVPVLKLKSAPAPEPGSRIYPRSRFLARFLAPVCDLAPGHRRLQSIRQCLLFEAGISGATDRQHLLVRSGGAGLRRAVRAAGDPPLRPGERDRVDDGGHGVRPGRSGDQSPGRRRRTGLRRLHGVSVDERTRTQQPADESGERTRTRRRIRAELPGGVWSASFGGVRCGLLLERFGFGAVLAGAAALAAIAATTFRLLLAAPER